MTSPKTCIVAGGRIEFMGPGQRLELAIGPRVRVSLLHGLLPPLRLL